MTACKPHLLMLLLLLSLGARGGLHLHLCFDGGGPAVSVHATDHLGHSAGAADRLAHDDADIFIGSSALPRLDSLLAHPPLLMVALLVLSLLVLPGLRLPPERGQARRASTSFRARPPTRAPPSPACR